MAVILLNNVWWIGEIGSWELGRIVALRNNAIFRRNSSHEDGSY